MSSPKADLILHPIRLRIVTGLAGRTMTTAALAAALPDVARATLYRHIKRLAEAGILEIAAETVVNGATERSYRLAQGEGRLTAADLSDTTRDELLRYFATYAASLIDAVATYATTTTPAAMLNEGFTFSRAVAHLTDDERAHFQEEINRIVGQMLALPPAPERRTFTMAMSVIPTAAGEEE